MATRRAAAAAALLLLAALAPGCGSGGSSGPVTVSIYVSLPLHGQRAPEGREIAAGARRALERIGGRVGEVRVRAVFLDDTGGGARWSMVSTAANARRAAEDSTTVGFLGDVDSGATRVSLPITNQAQIVQVSPAFNVLSTSENLGACAFRRPGPQRFRLQPTPRQKLHASVPRRMA